MAIDRYDRRVLANILLRQKVYNDICIIKSNGCYHSECHCYLPPSIYIYPFPLPFLSQAWDTKKKGRKNHHWFSIMTEPGEGSTVGFCDGSCHMQVMVLPWDAWGRGLLWDSTSDPSGLSHLETWY